MFAKVTVVKIVNYGTSVCGDVAAYISGSLLVCVRCTVRKYSSLVHLLGSKKTLILSRCTVCM